MGKNSEWINLDLVREAMQCFEKKKLPGPEDIKPVIFEYLPTNVLNHFIAILYYPILRLLLLLIRLPLTS